LVDVCNVSRFSLFGKRRMNQPTNKQTKKCLQTIAKASFQNRRTPNVLSAVSECYSFWIRFWFRLLPVDLVVKSIDRSIDWLVFGAKTFPLSLPNPVKPRVQPMQQEAETSTIPVAVVRSGAEANSGSASHPSFRRFRSFPGPVFSRVRQTQEFLPSLGRWTHLLLFPPTAGRGILQTSPREGRWPRTTRPPARDLVFRRSRTCSRCPD